MTQKNITIYSTETCHYCHLAKAYFDENKIAYTDYNVGKDQAKAEEMVKISGQMGVPVIDINGEIIVGFDRAKIEKALS